MKHLGILLLEYWCCSKRLCFHKAEVYLTDGPKRYWAVSSGGPMYKKLSLPILVITLTVLLPAAARAEIFTASLSGAQEVPAVATTATGYARVNVNEAAGTIAFTVVFEGLSSSQTASHIHAPAAIGASAGVIINFGNLNTTSGTITGTASITPTQIGQLRSHQGYVNVHSANFPGGEIRGQLARQRDIDYDGDGRNDISVLRFPTSGDPRPITYYNLNSTTGYYAEMFGNALTDFPIPGDYDGDGKGDIALYRNGAATGDQSHVYYLRSSDGSFQATPFGINGDQAVCRDYDGDGKTDLTVMRRGATPTSQNVWYIYYSDPAVNPSGGIASIAWGLTGNGTTSFDTPAPGDYDGDGKFDIAIYRFGQSPNPNTYIIRNSSTGQSRFVQWGNFNSDYVLPGDYDGDGKTDFAAARTGATAGSPLVWWILRSSDGTHSARTWGISSDLPIQADYDGDGRTDIAVYRRGPTAGSQNVHHIFQSFTQTHLPVTWGLQQDFPVANYNAR